MKPKFVDTYMTVANTFAQLSTAKRLKVGSIIVKEDRIISIGYNGTPSGWDNNCEDKIYNIRFTEGPDGTWMDPLSYKTVDIDDHYPLIDETGKRYRLSTKPEVIHAEANAIAKLAKCTESGKDSIMFLTHSPCIDCAKQIYTAGICKVYYGMDYRSTDGIDFLRKCNVEVVQWTIGVTI